MLHGFGDPSSWHLQSKASVDAERKPLMMQSPEAMPVLWRQSFSRFCPMVPELR